jgi:hypothetical protein
MENGLRPAASSRIRRPSLHEAPWRLPVVYEWDPVRAARVRKLKLAARLAITLSVFAVPAAFLAATIPI